MGGAFTFGNTFQPLPEWGKLPCAQCEHLGYEISFRLATFVLNVQGYLAHKKHPPPWDRHRFLGTGLLNGPMGKAVFMSEEPL